MLIINGALIVNVYSGCDAKLIEGQAQNRVFLSLIIPPRIRMNYRIHFPEFNYTVCVLRLIKQRQLQCRDTRLLNAH